VLGVELAHGADESHGWFAPVDDRDPAEHRAPSSLSLTAADSSAA
jgi:hypothetical protein